VHIIYIQYAQIMSFDKTIEFILAQTNGRPMYLQIMEQVKSKITIGDWSQGYKLPSIREMAVAAKVSVITVKRAYQELEIEGIIYTQQGRGSFVAQIDKLSIKLKEQEMNKHLNQASSIARSIGMTTSELQQRLSDLHQAKNPTSRENKND